MSWCHCGICQSGRTTDWFVAVDRLGAKGDGVTDDWAAIQAAIDLVSTTDFGGHGGVVVFPPGDYVVGDTLRLNPTNLNNGRVTLLGASNVTSILRFPPDRVGIDVGDGITYRRYLSIERLGLSRVAVGTSSVVRLRRINQFRISDCSFASGERTVELYESPIGEIKGCIFGDNVVDNYIYLSNSELVGIVGNYFERTAALGDGQCIHLAPGSHRALIVGNRFSTCVVAVEGAGGASTDVIVTGNVMDSVDNGVRVAGGCARWVVTGNRIKGSGAPASDGILFDGADCVADGNLVDGFTHSIRDTAVLGTRLGGNYANPAPEVNLNETILTGTTLAALRVSAISLNYGAPENIDTLTGGYQGQTITLFWLAGNASIVQTGNIRLTTIGAFLGATDDSMTLMYDGALWREIARAV